MISSQVKDCGLIGQAMGSLKMTRIGKKAAIEVQVFGGTSW